MAVAIALQTKTDYFDMAVVYLVRRNFVPYPYFGSLQSYEFKRLAM